MILKLLQSWSYCPTAILKLLQSWSYCPTTILKLLQSWSYCSLGLPFISLPFIVGHGCNRLGQRLSVMQLDVADYNMCVVDFGCGDGWLVSLLLRSRIIMLQKTTVQRCKSNILCCQISILTFDYQQCNFGCFNSRWSRMKCCYIMWRFYQGQC